jgi:hypothetical protein
VPPIAANAMSIGCCLSRAPTRTAAARFYGADNEDTPAAQKKHYDRDPAQRTTSDRNNGGQSTDRAGEHGSPNTHRPETKAEKPFSSQSLPLL